MTAVDLERIARSIIPPIGATMAIARVDEELKHRAAFLIDGRIHGDYVGPAFDRPRDALRLVDLLNGGAPRPRLDDSAVLGRTPSGDARVEPEAPVTGSASTSTSERTRVVCRAPLPPGARSDRRTCSGACRERARYQRAAEGVDADSDGATANLTPTRPSEDASSPDPTPSEAIGGYALPIASRAARPTDLSGIEGPGTQTAPGL